MGSSSSLSSHKSNNEDQLSLPKRYLYLQTLGQGGFGKVIKCFDLGTCKNVAVKINKRHKDHAKEVSILKFLMQHKMHRAPEIILGLPYCESIDIWSLGCLMAIMVLGCILFPGKHEYDTLRFIHNILGPPPDYLLSAGKKSKLYFTKTDSNRWTLKTPKEYWGTTSHSTDNRRYTFCSLDEAEKVVIEKYPREEAIRRLVCIDLLEAMLKWDPQERRTPSEILQHPFFTLDHLNMSDQRISKQDNEKLLQMLMVLYEEECLCLLQQGGCDGIKITTKTLQQKHPGNYS
ncbi:homeodomain-interacting protein kinase 3-like isoform X4 [Xyrichtys novacula]|uniref:Homeodomain-interacting protein kinase 3-like isoform X4 n=1 Tax=Xyrichtys novacula TaxID=13765 RepID=A0AAV1FL22_XYRNO|nr:homeodomain-interacting protein kinase 3-like isoform X4 [Xyrichtys novacula]